MKIMIHEHDIEHPRSEQELGEILRARALGEGVLDLIVRSDAQLSRKFRMYIESIHLTQEDGRLPYIIGFINEIVGDEEFVTGTGKLEVTGSQDLPESERPLRLHTVEDDELEE